MKGLVALTGTIVVLVLVSSASGAKSPSNWSVKPTKLNFGAVAAQGQAVTSVTITNTSSVTEMVAGAHPASGNQADFVSGRGT